jgi:3-oxoacyl-[acyl-carrier-protein] synthase II
LAVQVFGGSAHSNIAIDFGFRGVGTTNSNSCASGTVSVGEGFRYIRDNFADVVVAGGAEAPLTTITIGAFDIIKTMSRNVDPQTASRPFDKLRDGFVMGEGAASLILEELEHARARGAKIYAEVLGYSLNNDAFHMTTPLPSGDSCIRAMRDALADAHVAPEQIDYVNAHASSTQLNDSAETMAIKEVLGERAYKIPVSGTKGYHAHPLGATGAIEAALCALALDRQWVPPTINYAIADPACDLDFVPNHGRSAELNYIMSNSFGFGGINASIVLGRVRG